jgi:TrmH family RNA methyltransferase
MISKARLKYIKSLQVKKYRKQEQCFVVEGAKGVQELLRSPFKTLMVAGTEDFIHKHEEAIIRSRAEVIVSTPDELAQMGSFQSNDSALALAGMREDQRPVLASGEFALVLDDIRDPGNLGTIIRTADWYGLRHIIASSETADLYNPKVINATMGSFSRVNVYYTDLVEFISASGLPAHGAFLNGEDVHTATFGNGGLIVIGNESGGISQPLESLIKHRVTIPRFGGAESLNASVAAAVILDNVMRGQTAQR